MKVLVLGSGGREHALAWKIRKSPHVTWVGVAPGNSGSSTIAENIPIDPMNFDAIKDYVEKNDIALIVVGPEAPLAAGIADQFEPGRPFVFGPSGAAAELESSKRFAKEIMDIAAVPTAAYRAFTVLDEAMQHVKNRPAPMVIKASGLAAGKGVFVCESTQEAVAAINTIMSERAFGDSGSEVIVEDFLVGPEISVLALTDGENFLMLPPSQDHKRLEDGDTGPNTGGMGAYAPAPFVSDDLMKQVGEKVIAPTLKAMKDRGTPYSGVLYAGLILVDDGIKVLEYNCRFGDPETQAIMPLLSVDIVDLMLVSAGGKLGDMMAALNLKSHEWQRLSRTGACATIVMASGGYPGSYEKGKLISGLPNEDDLLVCFHAGTKDDGPNLLSSGGRVLAVSALGGDLKMAMNRAYEAVDNISFEGAFYRKDIGWQVLGDK